MIRVFARDQLLGTPLRSSRVLLPAPSSSFSGKGRGRKQKSHKQLLDE